MPRVLLQVRMPYGVSPRDQMTDNQRVSGPILKSRILELDRTRLRAVHGLFDLGRFAVRPTFIVPEPHKKQKQENRSIQSKAGSQSSLNNKINHPALCPFQS